MSGPNANAPFERVPTVLLSVGVVVALVVGQWTVAAFLGFAAVADGLLLRQIHRLEGRRRG